MVALAVAISNRRRVLIPQTVISGNQHILWYIHPLRNRLEDVLLCFKFNNETGTGKNCPNMLQFLGYSYNTNSYSRIPPISSF